MAKNPSSKNGSDIAPLILPAAAILVLYFMWNVLLPPKIGQQITTLQNQYNGLKDSSISWRQVDAIKTNSKQKTQELTLAQEQLEATQRQAQNLCGKQIAAVDQLETMGTLDGALQQQGLMITADRTLRDRSRMGLAATLDSATQRLLDEIQKSHVTSAKNQTGYLPAGLPRDISPEEYFASEKTSGRRQSAPDIQLREVELLGTYHHMLAALDQLNQNCGNSLVIGVSVRRPESLTSADSLRLWKLQLQVRPSPQNLPSESPAELVPLQLAAE